MPHCIIVISKKTELPAYSTGWRDQEEAFDEVWKKSIATRHLPAWIVWSYFYDSTMTDRLIKDHLSDLLDALSDNIGNRSPVGRNRLVLSLARLWDKIDKPFDVFHLPGLGGEYGFIYAQCARS
jgi:hypothetical protein